MNNLLNLYYNLTGEAHEDKYSREAMIELNNRITANLNEALRILEEEPVKEEIIEEVKEEKVEIEMNNNKLNLVTIEETREFIDATIQAIASTNKIYTNDYAVSHEAIHNQVNDSFYAICGSIFGDNKETIDKVGTGAFKAIMSVFGQDIRNKAVVTMEYSALDKKIMVNVLDENKKARLESYAAQLVEVFNTIIEGLNVCANEPTNGHTESEEAHNNTTVNQDTNEDVCLNAPQMDIQKEDDRYHIERISRMLQAMLEDHIKKAPALPAYILERIEASNNVSEVKTVSKESDAIYDTFEPKNDVEKEAVTLIDNIVDEIMIALSMVEGSTGYNEIMANCSKKMDRLMVVTDNYNREYYTNAFWNLAVSCKKEKRDMNVEGYEFALKSACYVLAESMWKKFDEIDPMQRCA